MTGPTDQVPSGLAPPAPSARLEGTFSVASGVLHRLVGDEVFVLMPDGRVHWLREPASRVLWEALAAERGADVAALVGALTAAFEVEPAQAEGDIRAFVTRLVDLGVLVAR